MVEVPESHPRYESLKTRESLVEGVEKGITSKAGLIAHGRGEMFDYLLGERTIETAEKAERKALAEMLEADDPVISINGNVAALVPAGIVSLADKVDAKLEVNLFHRTKERIERIERKNGREKRKVSAALRNIIPILMIPKSRNKEGICVIITGLNAANCWINCRQNREKLLA